MVRSARSWIVCALSLLAAACVPGEGPTGPASPLTDRDADAVPDSRDACPAQAEVPNNFLDGDGCPDSLDELVGLVGGDLDAFWRESFLAAGYVHYRSPSTLTGYRWPLLSPCGALSLRNAYYCPLSHGIYYDHDWLEAWLYGVGDFAPAFIVAHEWGHAVQGQLGYTRLTYYSIQLELQADCLGGAYARSAETRGFLDEGDVDEAVASLLRLGDAGTPWFHPQAHGTAEQRVSAFLAGYRAGGTACAVTRIDGSLGAAPPETPED